MCEEEVKRLGRCEADSRGGEFKRKAGRGGFGVRLV